MFGVQSISLTLAFATSSALAVGAVTASTRATPDLSAWNDPSVLFSTSVQRQTFSSAEREGEGRDAFSPFVDRNNRDFNRFLALCGPVASHPLSRQTFYNQKRSSCLPGERGGLMVDTRGPGVLTRLWLTSLGAGTEKLFGNELVHVWRDGELYFTGTIESLLSDQASEPLAGVRSGSYVSYKPIPYQKSLRVFLDRLAHSRIYYYQADTLTGAMADTPTEAMLTLLQSQAHASREHSAWTDSDHSLSLEPTSASRIEAIEFEFDSTQADLSPSAWFEMHERDGAKLASLPVRSLFGAQGGWNTLESQYARVERTARGYRARLSLPLSLERGLTLRSDFKLRALIAPLETVAPSEAVTPHEVGSPHNTVSPTQLYILRTRLGADKPVNGWFNAATLLGARGRLVGVQLWQVGKKARSGFVNDPMVYLEGDERLTLDGRVASLGTGTEDFFNGGWYFRGGAVQYPWHGLTRWQRRKTEGETAAYRWFTGADVVPFENELKLEFEMGPGKPELILAMESVVFLYLQK